MNKEEYLRKKLSESPSSPLAQRIHDEHRLLMQEQARKEREMADRELEKDHYIKQLVDSGFNHTDAEYLSLHRLEGLYYLVACDDTSITKEMFMEAAWILVPYRGAYA